MAYRETYEIPVDADTFEGMLTGGNDVGRIIITCRNRPNEALVYYTELDNDDDGIEILNVH